MLKNVLFSAALLSVVSVASAQNSFTPEVRAARLNKGVEKNILKTATNQPLERKGWINVQGSITPSRVPAKVSPMKAATTSVWFDYSDGAEGLSIAGYGLTQYDVAMLVPSRFAGAKVDSVSIMFFDGTKLSDVCYWIQSPVDGQLSFPASGATATLSYPISSSDIVSAVQGSDGKYTVYPSDFKLPAVFTVPEEGCVAGYSLTTAYNAGDKNDTGNFPIVTYAGNDINYGMLLHADGKWYNQYGSGDGNITMALHLDVSTCASNDVTVNGVIESTFKPGDDCEIPVYVTNNGYKAVESVSYILTIDGTKEAEKSMTLDDNYQIEGGSNGSLYVPATITEGEHFVSVEVTKVNGETNTASITSGTGYVLGVANPADRVSVVEEATSTACGYCPRGTVGLRKVKEALGDKVITLSVHGPQNTTYNDPMTCDDYSLFLENFVSGFPTAIVDRAASVDPYVGLGIGTDWYEKDSKGNLVKYKFALDKTVTAIANAYPSEGSIALSASLNDKKISANTTTTFNVDRESAPYSLVFVLTENCMTGTDSGKDLWSQFNYYSQEFIDAYYQYYGQDVSTYYIDSDMDEYKNGAYKYAETYNNVVVGAWGGTYQGVEACPIYGISAFGEDIVKGEPMTYNTTFDISKNTLIQGYDHLYLAVLLVNDNNNQIVNAAQVKLTDQAGINSAVKDNSKTAEVARYSIDGRKLDAPVKGLNIVKMADGSNKKVLVK